MMKEKLHHLHLYCSLWTLPLPFYSIGHRDAVFKENDAIYSTKELHHPPNNQMKEEKSVLPASSVPSNENIKDLSDLRGLTDEINPTYQTRGAKI